MDGGIDRDNQFALPPSTVFTLPHPIAVFYSVLLIPDFSLLNSNGNFQRSMKFRPSTSLFSLILYYFISISLSLKSSMTCKLYNYHLVSKQVILILQTPLLFH